MFLRLSLITSEETKKILHWFAVGLKKNEITYINLIGYTGAHRRDPENVNFIFYFSEIVNS